MASIKKRTKKDGSTVYTIEVVLYQKDGVTTKKIRKSTTFTPDPSKGKRANMKDLEKFAFDFETKCRNGSIVSNETTLRQYAERWLREYAEPSLETLTVENYRRCLNMVLEEIGHVSMSDLKPSTVKSCLDKLRTKTYERNGKTQQYSSRTINDCKCALSSLCTSAVLDKLLDTNPCTAARQRVKKKVDRKDPLCFTVPQAMKFLDAIEKPLKKISPAHVCMRNGKPVQIKEYTLGEWTVALKYRAAFQLAIFLGLRREELNGLLWSDLDFEKGCIEIERAAIYYKGRFEIKTPKSSAGYRRIFVPECVLDTLKQLKTETLENILKLGTAWKGSRKIESVPIFCSDTGSRLVPSDFNKVLKRSIIAINHEIENESERLPVLSMHKLRHTSASILISQGLDPVSVAARLGHSDPSITLSIYAHAYAEKDKAAAEAIERALVPGLEKLKDQEEHENDRPKIVNIK